MANRNFARSMRRKTQWAGFGDAAGAANFPAAVNVSPGTAVIISTNMIVQGAAGLVDEEVTITRMIGQWSATINSDSALASSTVAIGCLVARNEAINAGVASLPDPENEPDAEWLYWGAWSGRNPQNALRDGPISGGRMEFDVRSQRIVRAGFSTVWIAMSQATTATVTVAGRYLAKLT